jgi:preprotein translocase subunit SecE
MVIFKKKSTKSPKPKVIKPIKEKKGLLKVIFNIGGYFKGSWAELKMVMWPDRKSTWGLTLAVILFTAFFAILIVLLDDGFKELFKLIIK